MTFEHEFRRALSCGEKYRVLLEIARRHQAQGLPPLRIYDVVEAIWLEYGFNNGQDASNNPGGLQDNLEAVMDKVWYDNHLTSGSHQPRVDGLF